MKKNLAMIFAMTMLLSLTMGVRAVESDGASENAVMNENVSPRAIVYEEIDIPGDGEFYKITDDFEMPANSRVTFQGTWSPAYASLEFRLYAHSTGNGAYVTLKSGKSGGLNATAASVYSLYARSVDEVDVTGAINITN